VTADFGLLQGQPNFFQTALLGLQAGQKVAAQNRLDAAMQNVDLAKPETLLPVLKLDPQTGLGLLKAHDTQVAADREAAGRTALSQFLLSRFSPSKGGDPASTVTAPTLSMSSSPGAVTAPPSAMIPAAATDPVSGPAGDIVSRMIPITLGSEGGGSLTNPKVSPKGARGPMQVMPGTNANPGFGVAPAKDGSEAERARVGRDYLAAMVQRYGDPAKAWAAYNAGPGRLESAIAAKGDDWLSAMPAETRNYVGKNMAQLGQPQAPTAPSGQPLTIETAPILPQLSDDARALISADPDLYLKTQASLASIDESRLKVIGDAAEAQGAVAAAIRDQNIPYAQRRAFIQSQAAYLAQHGVTPEMIAGFDPTDQNINAQLVEALGVKGWQAAKNTEANNARADRADARAERADRRADEARAEGRVRFQERDKDRAAVAAGNIPNNTDDLNY